MCYKRNNESLNRVDDSLGQQVYKGDLVVATTTGRSHAIGVNLAVVTDPERSMVRQFQKRRIDGQLRWVLDQPRKLRVGFNRSVRVDAGQVHDHDLRKAVYELKPGLSRSL